MIRIGHGYDVHAFGGDKPLILGGVVIPDHKGLVAHSDGDVLLHAICDALLGAACLGDIGQHFPDDDSAYAGIDSQKLLSEVAVMLASNGYSIGNMDVTLVAQTPRMSSFIKAIKTNIARVLGLNLNQVNIKATTTEKLGYIGRKEGIAVHCVCVLN